jgi:hypothetical protein
MIDLEQWKKEIEEAISPDSLSFSYEEFQELIQALEEAKEIIKSDMPESAQYQRWLSRYFPDTRKEG